MYYKIVVLLFLFELGSYGFLYEIKDDTVWTFICPIALVAFIAYLCRDGKNVVDVKLLRWVSINGIVVLGTHIFLYRYFHVFVKHISWIANSDWMFFSVSFVLVYSSLFYVVVPFMNTYGYRILGKKRNSWKENFLV